MNVDMPGVQDWLVITLLAFAGGAVSGLRAWIKYRNRPGIRIAEGVAEWMTFIFLTFAGFLILHFVIPMLYPQARLHPVGSGALAAVVAHLGIRNAIRVARQISTVLDDPP